MANWGSDVKRILVIGGGLIGIRHVQAVQQHPACTLVGLVDPDMSIETDACRFASLDDVGGDVDGAIIATPTQLHAAHGVAAVQRGWHVLIEKPVAETLADARKLTACLQLAKTGSLVGHHRRYHAPVQQLKACLSEGRIGEIVNTSLIWAMRKPDDYFVGNWRTAGGSPVLINLVHDIDLLRFVVGEISQSVSLAGRALRKGGRIESGAIALAYENGATGTISFADTAPSPWGFEAGTGENPNIGTTHQDMLWITGTKGAISFPSMTLWQGDHWGKPARIVGMDVEQSKKAPLVAQLDHFIDVMDGVAPLIDVADGTRTLEIALDIEQQLLMQTGTPQTRTA